MPQSSCFARKRLFKSEKIGFPSLTNNCFILSMQITNKNQKRYLSFKNSTSRNIIRYLMNFDAKFIALTFYADFNIKNIGYLIKIFRIKNRFVNTNRPYQFVTNQNNIRINIKYTKFVNVLY